MKNLRFLHVVMIAISALLLLKVLGLVLQMPFGSGVPAASAEEGGGTAKPAPPPPPPPDSSGANIKAPSAKTLEQIQGNSSEQLLLESLGKRRDELGQRASELDLREKLLKAAEDKLNAKLDEMKKIEANLTAQEKKQQTDQGQPGEQLQKLVAMYEQMKPKDAAAIFEKMNIGTALALIKAMNPRKASPVLEALSPDLASRITAMLSKPDDPPVLTLPPVSIDPGAPPPPSDPSQLPKIGPDGLAK